MSAKRLIIFSLVGILLGLGLGAVTETWAAAPMTRVVAGQSSITRTRARLPGILTVPYRANVPLPQVTLTPALPDLTGSLVWNGYYPCPAPVLRIGAFSTQGCFGNTMRLQNSSGDYRDLYAGAGESSSASIECQVGYCIPYSWLQAMPFTLTVDYPNNVPETNENNNTSVLSAPPPSPTACSQVTSTPTRLPNPTATVTHTPAWPDLVGSMAWTRNPCPSLQMTVSGFAWPCIAAGASHMRLRDSNGDSMDFPVQSFNPNYPLFLYDCPLGTCLPNSWLPSMPFTLTVDVLNEVYEGYYGEQNNNSYLSIPPPPCGTTPTSTPDITATYAPTLTPALTSTSTATPSNTPTIYPTACPMSFSDVPPSDPFYTAIRYIYCRGAISGYADGTFRPFNNMTRGQVCKVVVLALQLPIDVHGGPHFVDVPENYVFYVWIETSYNRGLVSGYSDHTFRPGNNVTRGQMMKIICRALGWPPMDPPQPTFSDVPRSNPFYGYVEAAYCGGIITGYNDGTFRPNNPVTRGQVCQIMYRVLTGSYNCLTPTPIPPTMVGHR